MPAKINRQNQGMWAVWLKEYPSADSNDFLDLETRFSRGIIDNINEFTQWARKLEVWPIMTPLHLAIQNLLP